MLNERTLSTPLKFRDFQPSDYPRLVEILNAIYPQDLISIQEQRAFDEGIDKSKYLLRRFASLDPNGRVLGFGQIRHELDAYHPRKFLLNIFVDPADQEKGVRERMYHKVEEDLDGLRAILATVMVKEDLPGQLEFYHHRGFRESARIWESRLDLRTFDPTKFQPYIEKAEKEGIRFTDLAKERSQSGSLKGLHELVQLITADMPREGEFTPVSYEQYETLVLNSPRSMPEGYIIAKHGSEFVGMSDVFKNEKEPRVLTQDDTGVRREYRGRGIATALKLKVIEFAQRNWYEMIKTWNDSTNPAMLAVNTKLGFKRHVGWIRLQKTFRLDS
ncbi:MAG TPA: GNAT family N-acetyltransferase [Candidatus Bathyarchaeia archaeon]|jgi:GNAT superfamily N-acetyltransferase|nr:GNAT family N-acetyltransferase [Candidatus Bathyarchaeia archaeon]